MNELRRSIAWTDRTAEPGESLLEREWLITNGLGGYASGTLAGVLTRRYHGYLIAALKSNFGRRMMLPDVMESVQLPDGTEVQLSGESPTPQGIELHISSYLTEFRLESGLPTWQFQIRDFVIQRQLVMLQRQNTVYLTYTLLQGQSAGPIELHLRPAMQFRPHESPVNQIRIEDLSMQVVRDCYEFTSGPNHPPLRMYAYGDFGGFTFDRQVLAQVLFRLEAARGYEHRGDLWSPGTFALRLSGESRQGTLLVSAEDWDIALALPPEEAREAQLARQRRLISIAHPAVRHGLGAELVLAADQFVIAPTGRRQDVARAHAAGEEVRSVIAGYHWFTDWGRDTMISLEGLTLLTGRASEAAWILKMFSYHVREGLIPNMFPEGESEGLYHTADATLWFFHAVERYLAYTGDRVTLRSLLPKLISIAEHHRKGTRFGIQVDPQDGLLQQGAEGYQLTWMDAKVEDWVVTPRRGKAVEINALWYNALKLLEQWISEEEGIAAARPYAEEAARVYEVFNRCFWYEEGGYLYDLIASENLACDTACRPNQLFAISLKHPVLAPERWEPVLKVCQQRLVTPVGLRSLAPGHPDYKPMYFGDLRARDAAYHQGTVWGWLIGPFIDVWLKVYPEDREGARRFLEGFEHELSSHCLGTISEIFDAEAPYKPRGCVAQAWSVAEVLRCLVLTAPQPLDSAQ
jgi:predicted glycogen debranching enzyme